MVFKKAFTLTWNVFILFLVQINRKFTIEYKIYIKFLICVFVLFQIFMGVWEGKINLLEKFKSNLHKLYFI